VCKELFSFFDKEGSGTISFDEFVVGLRGDLSGVRLDIVKEAFEGADRSGDGLFGAFLQSYQQGSSERDGIVTEEEFIKYYAGISASIDNDDYFVLLVRNAWAI